MVDLAALVAAVTDAEAEILGVTNYDGHVPEDVPELGGYIQPYITNWFGTGSNPDETQACGTQPADSLIWDFQTTVVASNAAACRAVAQALTQKLLNLRVGTGTVRRNPDGFDQPYPIPDTQLTPARLMLPLQWRLITN